MEISFISISEIELQEFNSMQLREIYKYISENDTFKYLPKWKYRHRK